MWHDPLVVYRHSQRPYRSVMVEGVHPSAAAVLHGCEPRRPGPCCNRGPVLTARWRLAVPIHPLNASRRD